MTSYPDCALDPMPFQGPEADYRKRSTGRVREVVCEAGPRGLRTFEPELPRARAVTSSKPKASAIPPKRAPARARTESEGPYFLEVDDELRRKKVGRA